MASGLGNRITRGFRRIHPFFPAVAAASLLAGAAPLSAGQPLAGAPADPPYYFVVDIGNLSDGKGTSVPHAINDANAVVGASVDLSGTTHAFYWSGGAMRDLGILRLLQDGLYSQAEDINDSGQIVGTTYSDAGPFAARWDRDGVSLLPGLCPAADPGIAHSINNQGEVAGYVGTADHKEVVALWRDGRVIEIGLPGPSFDTAHGLVINDAGQIAGQATARDEVRAFRYDSGTWTLVPDLPGGGYANLANDMNAAGQIVGKGVAASGSDHGFFWDGARVRDIGDLPGGKDASHAFGLNDRGQVVGYSATVDGNAAVLWSEDEGRLLDLNDCIDPESGWRLVLAKDINNSGWITGYGIAPNGATHGFVLIPE